MARADEGELAASGVQDMCHLCHMCHLSIDYSAFSALRFVWETRCGLYMWKARLRLDLRKL